MGVTASPLARGEAAETSSLRVTAVPEQEAAAWNEFLARQPGGSFYHLHEWSRVNRATMGHESIYLAAYAGTELRGVLPLTFVTSALFGRILCSMPFVNFGGPCAVDAAATAALVKRARQIGRERKVRYLELRCPTALETDMPVSTRKISMMIELDKDPEALFGRFTSKHRTNIRRSIKNELVIASGGAELLPVFYGVMEQSWRSLGTPLYARSYFERIVETFGERTRIFVCTRHGAPVAVAFNGYFNGVVEGLWAGGTPEARPLQANYALYWDMIRDACERGFSRYHLGRSTAESGAEDFKKKWNAHAEQLYWYFDRPDGGPMPELNVNNAKFQLAIKAWRKLPLAVTRLAGPTIARAIP